MRYSFTGILTRCWCLTNHGGSGLTCNLVAAGPFINSASMMRLQVNHQSRLDKRQLGAGRVTCLRQPNVQSGNLFNLGFAYCNRYRSSINHQTIVLLNCGAASQRFKVVILGYKMLSPVPHQNSGAGVYTNTKYSRHRLDKANQHSYRVLGWHIWCIQYTLPDLAPLMPAFDVVFMGFNNHDQVCVYDNPPRGHIMRAVVATN